MAIAAMTIFIGLVLLLVVGAVVFGLRQRNGGSVEIVRFIAVGALATIGLFCIFGLLYLSTPPPLSKVYLMTKAAPANQYLVCLGK